MEIKQWSVATAQFHIIPPDRLQKNRIKKFRDIRACAAESLNMTPYVKVQWQGHLGSQEDYALMDTGAQWTLISAEKLSQAEKEGITQTELSGQGVSGEKIPILGEIWRDVRIGHSDFQSQRFVVVEKMICPIILGMDFWSRATELSFDFPAKSFVINNNGIDIQLYSNPYQEQNRPDNDSDKQPCEVLIAQDTVIPPKSEIVVACCVPRMKQGQDYLVEPVSLGERWVGTPYGIVEGRQDGAMGLKVTNLEDEEATLKEGDCIATISSEQDGRLNNWQRNQ